MLFFDYTPSMTKRALFILLLFALAVTLFGPILAFAANTGACYSISDGDVRTYCLARERREPAQCYSIQRNDLRQQCLAEVRR